GNRVRFAAFGLEARLREINQRGVFLARAAAGTDALLAGSLGPTGFKDIGAHAAEIGRAYGEQASTLADAGVDFLLLETMTSPEEARIAVDSLKKSTPLDVVCSFAFTRVTTGAFVTWSGASIGEAVQMVRESGVHMVGVNCVPANEDLHKMLASLHAAAPDVPLWLKPNAGSPHPQYGQPAYPSPVNGISIPSDVLVDMNVAVIGGCCGTTPEHTKVLADSVAAWHGMGKNLHRG
ncbi:MAG: homocysteine S-methyltransferase family protein, partial [Candidatus Hydrogenedentes bacterium]|nr:homocysteine S-methyltransferase family protein [Candidatus Hydrogenedentota bacterium]